MNYEQMLQWAERWNYPFLALADGKAIRHGKEHYQYLRHDAERMHQVLVRIERWNRLVRSNQREMV